MNEKPHLLCIATPQWEGNYAKSTVKLMTFLTEYFNIVYVNYAFTIKDVLMGVIGKLQIPLGRILGLTSSIKTVTLDETGEKIHIVYPYPIIPANWVRSKSLYLFITKINSLILRKSIKSSLKKIKFQPKVVINAFNPFLGLYNIDSFGEDLNIYYCYDQIKEAEWLGVHGGWMEKLFIEKAGHVACSSQPLLAEKSKFARSSILLKNGVDFDLFTKYKRKPSQSKKIKIGFTGSIDNRLDYDLLSFVVKELPDCEFIFIGRVQSTKEAGMLGQYHNVQFLEPVPYENLPEIQKTFDIGILPFVKNEFTYNIYPMKINEYLATGLPVISTDFTSLDEFAEIISIAGDKESFVEIIKNHKNNSGPIKTEKGIELAKKNSWKQRSKDLYDYIKDYL